MKDQGLPPDACQLQKQLDELQTYSHDNQMKINRSKCKVMIFNSLRRYAVKPRLTLSEEGAEYFVQNLKLLGVKLRSDMRWCDNTDYI